MPLYWHTALQAEEDGPIDAPKTVADVRKEPYAIPDRWVGQQCRPVWKVTVLERHPRQQFCKQRSGMPHHCER